LRESARILNDAEAPFSDYGSDRGHEACGCGIDPASQYLRGVISAEGAEDICNKATNHF